MPVVRRDRRSSDTSSCSGVNRVWTLRIASRPTRSGCDTVIWRSNRPGRKSALSRISTRLVAASTTTALCPSKPSSSTSNWLSVWSRSSLPDTLIVRLRPTASISSIKTTQGADWRAWLKRSRTRLAPTPTNISTNSEALMLKKGTPASPATAFASSVLPVPGGPTSKAPRGIRAPRRLYRSGLRKNCTISTSSDRTSSIPATSSNVTCGSKLVWFFVEETPFDFTEWVLVNLSGPMRGCFVSVVRSKRRARLFPSWVTRSSIERFERIGFLGANMSNKINPRKSKGTNRQSSPIHMGGCATGRVLTITLRLKSIGIKFASPLPGRWVKTARAGSIGGDVDVLGQEE